MPGPTLGPQTPPLSLSTIIKLIKPLRSRWYLSLSWTAAARRWAGGVTNVSGMNVFVCVCDEDTALLFLFDTFLLRLFLRSAAKMLADGECWWGGGSLPCAHTAAPSRPSSTRPQVGCLGHTSLTHCSSREADLPHTQMVYSPGLQRYHQFGVWGDFSGANYFLWCLWGTGDVPPQGSIQFIIPKEKTVCREKVVGIVVGQFVVGTSCPV